ncbi:hypothetical protein GCM10023093_09960 [Nemorincola caseinilytica]|uniref:META domain-containing protein n=1 Tax=Nemorincola caseinilytica TaxID=2054315 RepID=A0ABP8NAK9_9BACT
MRQTTLLLLFVACTLAACRRTPPEPPTIKVPYNGQYEVIMHEWRAMKKLSLEVSTTEVLNCNNYYISPADSRLDQGTIRLSLQGLSIRGGCEPGRDNARTDAQYELANGVYPLSIVNNGVTMYGSVTVTDSAFIVFYDGGNNVTFINKVLRRLPKNTVLGVIYSFDSTAFAHTQSFIDSLVYYGAQPFVGEAVQYDRITVLPGNTFTKEDDAKRTEYYRNFIYTYAGKVDDLKQLARRYNDRTNGQLSIYMEDPDGNIINSYAID